ncbi:MAG: histidine triad nucleotide-binding protein [Candidatus Marinimicrobia bacterium]|nr:histidine triad nucleotide-binding protein [Candidatus Neomarinimicrobiota bacterium]MBL7059586.1 histidine triad nucleotide-binding protein [Candidatus Neomarinimicrobiota bacterium]
MTNCLFCKIVEKEILSDIVFENDNILAFRDINPQAPTHILIIPKEHIFTLNDLKENHQALVGEMLMTAKLLADDENISEEGYRTVFNCNSDGGQEVYHIHLHLLGGRKMTWPPG